MKKILTQFHYDISFVFVTLQNHDRLTYTEGVERGIHAYMVDDYSFAGIQLSANYLKTTLATCSRCHCRIVRTKAAMNHGCGVRMFAYSCKCVSVSIPRDLHRERLALEHWDSY